MKNGYFILVFLTLPFIWGCVEDITADIPQGPVRLVVEGRITNQKGPYVVRLSETEGLNDSIDTPPNQFSPATGALVRIVDDLGGRIILTEDEPGVYRSGLSLISGEIGRSYSVIISTKDGRQYASKPETMLPVPEIDEILVTEEAIVREMSPVITTPFSFNPILNNQPLITNWQSIVTPIFVENLSQVFTVDRTPFEGQSGFILGWFNPLDNAQILDDTEILAGLINDVSITQADILSLATITQPPPLKAPTRGFRISVKAKDPAGEKNYYRWSFKGTFSIDSDPQRFSFLTLNRQGTLLYAVNAPKVCCSQCWYTFDFDDIVLLDDRLIDGNDFELETILVPLDGFLFDQNFHIEIQQTSLTFEAYQFFQSIQAQTEAVGSIFDSTPAISRSNISNINDPNELVLGYFHASAVSSSSRFLGTPSDIALRDEFVYYDDCRTIGNQRVKATTIKPDFWPN